MGSLTVRGRGSAAVRPDEVDVVLEVSSVRDAAAEALADVTQRAAALDAVYDELGIAPSALRTTNVSVHEYREYDDEAPSAARHRATSRTSVRLAEAELVPRLLRAAVERAQARVEGPMWRVAGDNPARLEASRRAVTDARRRAEAYAGALGARLDRLERAVDVAGHEPVHATATLGLALEADLAVHAPELEVTAMLEVTYALEDA